MEKQHWFMLVVVALVFYFLGVKYPSYGNSAITSASSIL